MCPLPSRELFGSKPELVNACNCGHDLVEIKTELSFPINVLPLPFPRNAPFRRFPAAFEVSGGCGDGGMGRFYPCGQVGGRGGLS